MNRRFWNAFAANRFAVTAATYLTAIAAIALFGQHFAVHPPLRGIVDDDRAGRRDLGGPFLRYGSAG